MIKNFGNQYRIMTDRGIVVCDNKKELDEELRKINSFKGANMSLLENVKKYLTESPNTFDYQMKLLMKDPSKYDDMLSDMKRVHAGKYAPGAVDHYFKDKYHAKLAHDRYKNHCAES